MSRMGIEVVKKTVESLKSETFEDESDSHGWKRHPPVEPGPAAPGRKDDPSADSFVGSPSTFLKDAKEERDPAHHIKYSATDPWFSPPITAWVPETNRSVLAVFLLYNILITLLARFTPLCGDPAQFLATEGQSFCDSSWLLLEDKAITGFSVGLFLLLAFRANQAYDRWWEGRKMWGKTREVCRCFARLICHHVEISTEPQSMVDDLADRKRVIDYLTAYGVALKLHLREEKNILLDLIGDGTSVIASRLTLTHQDVANIQQSRNMPLFCLDMLSDYIAKQVNAGKLTDYQAGIINAGVLQIMSDTLGDCERILRTPIPLSYVLQLRFFLILWLVLYPLNAVALYGWYTIPLATFVSTAVLGIESMASEIENPFGYDANDLPLDSFCDGICEDTQEILKRNESAWRDKIFDRKTVERMSAKYHYEYQEASRRSLVEC